MINIDIKIGDTILTGKFRNHPVVVKTIGTDEHGGPTINDKPILKIRLKKDMKHIEKIVNEILKTAGYIMWDQFHPFLIQEKIPLKKIEEIHKQIPDWGLYPEDLEKKLIALGIDHLKANKIVKSIKIRRK